MSEFDLKYDIINKPTPRQTHLCGRYKKSFAYYTLRTRLPITLTSIIDNMTKDKEEIVAEYGEDSREEIKAVIGLISKLKYELQTDKALVLFTGNEPDKELWNKFLVTLSPDINSFFKACWLHAECYMYRKVYSFFEATKTLQNFDYFSKQKQNALTISMEVIEAVLNFLRFSTSDDDSLKVLLKLNLWGNRCDLSITSGKEVRLHGDPVKMVSALDSNIIINKLVAVCKCINSADRSKPIIITFVCDNAGYELFTDLALADYLVENQLATKVVFHVKALPWFISDITHNDFHWTLQYMKNYKARSSTINEYGKKWIRYVEEGIFEVAPSEYFWTSPYEYYKMRDVNKELYQKLAESHLIIFKGDLNYRKLIGDYAWDPTEVFITCLRGFQPANICSLRTVKADLICGLQQRTMEELFVKNKDWMVTGEYGTVQFALKSECGCE